MTPLQFNMWAHQPWLYSIPMWAHQPLQGCAVRKWLYSTAKRWAHPALRAGPGYPGLRFAPAPPAAGLNPSYPLRVPCGGFFPSSGGYTPCVAFLCVYPLRPGFLYPGSKENAVPSFPAPCGGQATAFAVISKAWMPAWGEVRPNGDAVQLFPYSADKNPAGPLPAPALHDTRCSE
jgi:hypothetical protein